MLKDCRRCKVVFDAVKKTLEFCSVACARLGLPREERDALRRERRQRANHRRRARAAGVQSEHYTLFDVAFNDAFVCQLCEKQVDMRLRVPDPAAPTVDHIIPFAESGTDTFDNVQLAHLKCNQDKGNR